jgi:hypothetical protein
MACFQAVHEMRHQRHPRGLKPKQAFLFLPFPPFILSSLLIIHSPETALEEG